MAKKYIAHTEYEAMEVARQLNFVGKNHEDPSNMCGPLAFAPLRDAGVVDRYIDLLDVWLLNPPSDQEVLEAIFPRDKFEWFHFQEPINEFDFEAFPLQTGDLLFLYGGHSGTFQHVLTVTRTDDEGRAYSVTNVNTVEGYIVEEWLLYDPADPEAGLFNRWTNREFLMLGRTGFGGFDLWRPKRDFPTYPGDQATANELDRIIRAAGGKWHALVQIIPSPEEPLNPGDKVLYTRLANERINVASVVKVPIAMLLFSTWEEQGVLEKSMAQYVNSEGLEGKTFDHLLRAMLVHSEEPATHLLYDYLNQQINVDEKLASWGVASTIYTRKFTLNDMARLFEMLYRGEVLSGTSREMILGYMAAYTANDDLRIGALRDELPSDYQIYNKRGSLTSILLVGDMAILENPRGPDYLVAFFAFQGENPTTYDVLESALGEAAGAVLERIRALHREWE